MTLDVGTILDGVILIALCATIFYAARLSTFMTTFREGKEDFEKLMGDLGRNIVRAEQAIATMRTMAATSGQELQNIVNESKFLSDELRFMNEAGDSLAGRLEKLAERNRELIDLLQNAGGIGPATVVSKGFTGRSRINLDELEEEASRSDKSNEPFFKIQDREFIKENNASDDEVESWGGDSDDDGDFQSQAERDLYEALQKGRQKSRAGGVV
jgi:hypothetical protein